MPYYEIANFAAGMDLRKSPITAPAGTLRMLQNAHVTAGGEIEKRSAFTQFSTVPANTFGLVSVGGLLYSLKPGGGYVAATPTTVGQIAVPIPAGVTFDDVYDWDLYSGNLYVSMRGHTAGPVYGVYHFYHTGAISTNMTEVTEAPGGLNLRTYKTKIHTVAGNRMSYSCGTQPLYWVNNATSNPIRAGAGYTILSQEDSDMDSLVGLEVYYDSLAIFSTEAVQLWYIDGDPNKNQYKQTLRQSGTIAPRSIRQYGSGDVLFLGADGIRSLKAREQSLSAAVSDIGSPIDALVRDLYATQTQAYMAEAVAQLQPFTGRYWMCFPDRIYVLSNYPNPKISAWSVYFPGFTWTDIAENNGAIYFRTTDNRVMKYGGLGAPVYDRTAIEVVTPFLNIDKPATFKQFQAIDVICTGTWEIYAAMNINDQNAEDLLGTVTGPTMLTGQFPMMGHSTHISLRFRHTPSPTDPIEPATLASVIIHYAYTETS